MVRKIAIDWDESELRLVAAQCSGTNVKVTEAALIGIQDGDVMETLRRAISERGLERTDTLVAIGRGKAELRELQLPPVPDDELPDMVRYQAIRSFASAGESATVDFLVTGQSAAGTSMIAAAVGPAKLSEIHEICEASDLQVKRISLRPLAAAALFLAQKKLPSTIGETVLIDLLSDDAEIVVARNGKVVFVRTVRLPSSSVGRPAALAGELRRSLVACGAGSAPDRVVLWGLASMHEDDVEKIAEASGSPVDVVNPFDLVELDRKARAALPQHVGRLAPLVGLLASDEFGGDRLIDFLNPRKRVEEKPNPLTKPLLIGIPVAAALLLAFLGYRQFSNLDKQIAELEKTNKAMEQPVKLATSSRERTERVDLFLDGGVNWLNELRQLAQSMPPAETMIVKSVSGSVEQRAGGGTLQITGAVTDPSVIDEFEESVRDQQHRVVGDGAKKDEKSNDSYRWGFDEKITVDATTIRNLRYTALAELSSLESSGEPAIQGQDVPEAVSPSTTETVESEPSEIAESPSDQPAPDQPAPDHPAPDESPPVSEEVSSDHSEDAPASSDTPASDNADAPASENSNEEAAA